MSSQPVTPKAPQRSFADPFLPLPVRIEDIINKSRRTNSINFVYHNGYFTVWGRTAHHVALICDLSIHYVNGYAMTAWLPEEHSTIHKLLEKSDMDIPLTTINN